VPPSTPNGGSKGTCPSAQNVRKILIRPAGSETGRRTSAGKAATQASRSAPGDRQPCRDTAPPTHEISATSINQIRRIPKEEEGKRKNDEPRVAGYWTAGNSDKLGLLNSWPVMGCLFSHNVVESGGERLMSLSR